MKVAVVTPYHREPIEVIRRAHESVLNQSFPVDHFVVADGHPSSQVSTWDVNHIVLPKEHQDAGNFARGLGALEALRLGYDAVAFLDADNWYNSDHIQTCVETANKYNADIVKSWRSLHFRDGRQLAAVDRESRSPNFADTNTLFITKTASLIFAQWCLIPQRFGSCGDRVIWEVARNSGYRIFSTNLPTVCYATRFSTHYKAYGVDSPNYAISHDYIAASYKDWKNTSEIERRRYGLSSVNNPSANRREVIVTVTMPNIPPEIKSAWESVLKKFCENSVNIVNISTTRGHSQAIDSFLRKQPFDDILLLDVDCIPLSVSAIKAAFDIARSGNLFGAAQRANHIENGKHVYAGPFCMAFSKETYERLGMPSFSATKIGDVGENMTYEAQRSGLPVHLLWPTHVERPIWELTEQVKFGYGTTYSNQFWHAFSIRHPAVRQRFMDKCAAVLG